jgi:hypothetical protein
MKPTDQEVVKKYSATQNSHEKEACHIVQGHMSKHQSLSGSRGSGRETWHAFYLKDRKRRGKQACGGLILNNFSGF